MGPSDLYKLAKEVGKFLQNLQTFSTQATAQIENNLESNLQLEEIRKAQRELNDAFNFRRSINVESDTDPFEVNAQSPRMDTATAEAAVGDAATATAAGGAAATGAVAAPKKIRRRRRVKKKKVPEEAQTGDAPLPAMDATAAANQDAVANNVPDLEMSDAEKRMMESLDAANEELRQEQQKDLDEANKRREAYLERLQAGGSKQEEEDTMAQKEMASGEYDLSTEDTNARFQAQLSNDWNSNILAKEDELSPLADIMERLAILEEEKNAADQRLQEEFRLREENEEKFYREKRALLEQAAAKVQTDAYVPAENKTTSA